jgi:hypothetical protein
MNEQQLFLSIVAALIVGNLVNKLVINPLIYRLQSAIFGNGHSGSKIITGSAKSESSIIVK